MKFRVPFTTTITHTEIIEADNWEDAYDKATAINLPDALKIDFEQDDSWEIDHENIEEVEE